MELAFPYGFDLHGRTASTDEQTHVRDLIEQVLFTSPGERVNRPTFGSGALHLVFAPGGDAMAAATQIAVHGALQQWLGDIIQVEAVDVTADDSTVRVRVQYIVRSTQSRTAAEFVRAGP